MDIGYWVILIMGDFFSFFLFDKFNILKMNKRGIKLRMIFNWEKGYYN